MGKENNYQFSYFYFLGFNTYPLIWVLVTTPITTLLLAFIGLVSIWRGKDKGLAILLTLWLFVPFLRVMIPGASIYGGIRQIMEFLPALILFASCGFLKVVSLVKNK